jgi:Flavin-binding monooxygenase-like
MPAAPGILDFKGQALHTATWPQEVNLEDKRVAVIGPGPSAAQIIPSIQPIVKSLTTVYQRNIAYCIPRADNFCLLYFQLHSFRTLSLLHSPLLYHRNCRLLLSPPPEFPRQSDNERGPFTSRATSERPSPSRKTATQR